MNETTLFLLSIRGTFAPSNLEAARTIHNATAGSPQGVAAAKSLGDLSHMVHVPATGAFGEFLILDIWNSAEGLNQFFSNKQVQEQGGQIFTQRDPVVWVPAEGFTSYHLPTVSGKNERLVGIVRGTLPSLEAGCQAHNALVSRAINKARQRGSVSHEAYLRLTPPGTPQSLEFFAVDVWMDGAGMAEHYSDPDFLSGFPVMFSGAPDATVWTRPGGDWAEW